MINKFITEIEDQLCTATIHFEETGVQSELFSHYCQVIKLLELGFNNLKTLISSYSFDNPQDEIRFFKEVKPKLFSKLIYYRKVYYFETRRPTNNIESQKMYIEQEQRHIKNFFDKNIDFIQYYRSGKTILDEYYFVRGKYEFELNIESFYFERDPTFSTNYDFKVAKILANDMLASYLNAELFKLDKLQRGFLEQSLESSSSDIWSDTKSALVELVYGIHTLKSINHGNVDLKVIASRLEKIYHIDLGDIYRIFLEIRGRKGNRTVYLTRMIEALNKRMDEADDK